MTLGSNDLLAYQTSVPLPPAGTGSVMMYAPFSAIFPFLASSVILSCSAVRVALRTMSPVLLVSQMLPSLARAVPAVTAPNTVNFPSVVIVIGPPVTGPTVNPLAGVAAAAARETAPRPLVAVKVPTLLTSVPSFVRVKSIFPLVPVTFSDVASMTPESDCVSCAPATLDVIATVLPVTVPIVRPASESLRLIVPRLPRMSTLEALNVPTLFALVKTTAGAMGPGALVPAAVTTSVDASMTPPTVWVSCPPATLDMIDTTFPVTFPTASP